MINARILGILVAGFVAGSFIASPELRAYAANTVGSIDIIDGSIQTEDIGNGQVKAVDLGGNAVTSSKIKDGEVKAPDIATDAVGANQINGVAKLLFVECDTQVGATPAGGFDTVFCPVFGADANDEVIVSSRKGSNCMVISQAFVDPSNTSRIHVDLRNVCGVNVSSTSTALSVVVFDK